MTGFGEDLKFGVRSLCKTPIVTIACLLTLAIGIGATSAVFSVINATILAPLPFPDSGSLIAISQINLQSGRRIATSISDLQEIKLGTPSLALLAGYQEKTFTIGDKAAFSQISGALVTDSFFTTVGARMLQGRSFRDDDPDGTIVISESLRREFFGNDPQVLGRAILLDGHPATIVGVVPTGMWLPSKKCQLWRLINQDFPLFKRNGDYRFLHLLGRRRPGVSIQRVQSELAVESRRLAEIEPDLNAHIGILAIPLAEDMFQTTRPALMIVMGAVIVVLLVVVANIANLQFSRSIRRQNEFVTRMLFGASRFRILRLLLAENLLLSVAGGVIGMVIAFLGAALTLRLSPSPVPIPSRVSTSPKVLLFEAVLCLVIGLALGSVSSLQAVVLGRTRAGVMTNRTVTGTRGVRFWYGILVVSETAVTVTLLVAVMLIVQSYFRLSAIDVGFKTKDLITLTLRLPIDAYPDKASLLAIQRRLHDRIAEQGGVVAVSASSDIPLVGYFFNYFSIKGEGPVSASDRQLVIQSSVSPGYFNTMQIPILSGREFVQSDRDGSHLVAIINESMRRAFFGNTDPIGHEIRHGLPDEPTHWYTIIGVVGDSRPLVTIAPSPRLYTPYTQIPQDYDELLARPTTLEVRTTDDAASSAISSIRATVQELDPALGYDIRSSSDIVEESLLQPRFHALLFCFFGVITFWLSAVGIYGVASNMIEQETRALGIRLALGATRPSIAMLVLRRGAIMSGVGILVGSLISMYLVRILHSLLFEIRLMNPVIVISAASTLFFASLLAVYGPARAASRIEPVKALRQE